MASMMIWGDIPVVKSNREMLLGDSSKLASTLPIEVFIESSAPQISDEIRLAAKNRNLLI